ncbi:MAG: hypothetical protein BWY15_01289 [Firmicutes bacterium ADurb.Bin193]|nr:MAG: hypothetical protein BWY15_01289 [Firmicutes bacterium ADurb.Bin193]
MSAKEIILKNLPEKIRELTKNENFEELEEIRLRSNRPVILSYHRGIKRLAHTASQSEIEQTLQIISGASVYAYIEEIKNCFITLEGGHRVGLCGTTVVNEGQIQNLIRISGINFRIARQVKGAADEIMPFVFNNTVQNTLIISPPQCGKTTIIRDLARRLGQNFKVSIMDERGEIAAMYRGAPSHDIGEMTDVLDLCPKSIGIPLVLRSMSPDLIITDEIAHCDIEAIKQALSCGVKIIATAHGDSIEQVVKRIGLEPLMDELGCIITLSRRNGPGTVEQIRQSPKFVGQSTSFLHKIK